MHTGRQLLSDGLRVLGQRRTLHKSTTYHFSACHSADDRGALFGQ